MNTAAFWETIAALVLVTGIGLGLIWIGFAYWRNVRRTRGGIPATATIDKLDYTGSYLMGGFFARVSFRDIAGVQHAARLSLAPFAWNRLREGGTVAILYAPADPRIIGPGGGGLRAASGIAFVVIGSFLTLLGLWILVGGLAGWIEVKAFHPHRGWLPPLPGPRGDVVPGGSGAGSKIAATVIICLA